MRPIRVPVFVESIISGQDAFFDDQDDDEETIENPFDIYTLEDYTFYVISCVGPAIGYTTDCSIIYSSGHSFLCALPYEELESIIHKAYMDMGYFNFGGVADPNKRKS